MKYGKAILSVLGLYLLFLFIKIVVVDNILPKTTPDVAVKNDVIKLILDFVWLIASIYIWRRITKSKSELLSEKDSSSGRDTLN